MILKIWNRYQKYIIRIFPAVYLFCAWVELEISDRYHNALREIFDMNVRYILLNILTLGVLYAIFVLLTNRLGISGIIFYILVTIIAVVNYYCIKLHGLPFTIHELKNAKAAFNVLDTYKIKIERNVVLILIVFAFNIVLCCIQVAYERNREHRIKRWKQILVLVPACIVVMYFGYFSNTPIKPRQSIKWVWTNAYHSQGYAACSVESISQCFNIYNMPEGYSDEKVNEIEVEEKEAGIPDVKTPDVILILNETFYDISLISEVETDIPYLENFYSMENVIRGYAAVPQAGGGTNHSEYELLTGNSLQIFNNVTPFNVLDMKDANSIVSHFNSLGYTTIGAHASEAINYNRARAYPNIGFDEVYFIDDFQDIATYGKRRHVTDEAMYHNLYTWLEENGTDSPVFAYLLTMQNHGGWENNEEKDHIVHVLGDYGEWNDDLNEYLSCIKLSDMAFADMVSYFEERDDRPVVICMVGDHAPTFAADIASDDLAEEDWSILARSTPFIIWANYDLKAEDVGTVSLNYLTSILLDVAGIQTSPYYDYMIKLRQDVPVLFSGCYDVEEYGEAVEMYFYMEYNNLSNHRRQELFEPK